MDRSLALVFLTCLFLACSNNLGGSGSAPDGGAAGGGGGGGGEGGGGDDPGDGEGAAEECGTLEVQVGQAPPTMQLVVDRSGSMDADFGDTNRWDAVYETLMEGEGVVTRLQDQVRFGLQLYTGDPDDGCPLFTTVEPALGNYQTINSEYAPRDEVNDTPTNEAIEAATEILQGVSAPGPKFMVLATDGLPDLCESPDADQLDHPDNGAARQASIDAVEAAYEAGIETFVVSVGDEVGDEHLQSVANAGAGLPVGGDEDAEFYEALDPDQLVTAFDDIVGGVASCTFEIQGEVDPDVAAEGQVSLDGEPLAYGEEWELATGSTLQLVGGACDTVKDGGDHVVRAAFPCGAEAGEPDAGPGGDEPDGGIIVE